MQGFTRDYRGIEGITRVYKDLRGITRDYGGFQIKDYRRLQGYTWVCKGFTGAWKGLHGFRFTEVIQGYTRVYSISITCQFFLKYKRKIFILGVLGFLKTTRSFPKIISQRSLKKKSEVFRRRVKSSEVLGHV